MRVVFGKELKDHPQPEKRLAEPIAQYHDEFASPYQAAKTR